VISTNRGPVTVAVVGAGSRGREAYGRYCLEHPTEGQVVAVAEPDDARREIFADQHGLVPTQAYVDWRDLLHGRRIADAVIIATPDAMHVEPALAALDLGYHVLLEKPIGPRREDVLRLAAAAAEAPAGSITVAHVLRYTPFFGLLKRLVDQGAIGRLMAIQHSENIGYWHFAHSFVRGNWRSEAVASPMILAKACHDLDLMRWLAGAPCSTVASVGRLSHFRPENVPPGAPARCTDGYPVADSCAFYAPRFYLELLEGVTGWPISTITNDPTPEGVMAALQEGPYGRCVYRCHNDVPDHQAVLLEFTNGVSATLNVSAFTADNTRTVKLMGTDGELRGRLDTGEIEFRRFSYRPEAGAGGEDWQHDAAGRAALRGGEVKRTRVAAIPRQADEEAPIGYAGHGGGDEALTAAFLAAVRATPPGRPISTLTSLAASVESHLIAFAAERSRRERRMVELAEPAADAQPAPMR
jgi:predicted dehydrogenase